MLFLAPTTTSTGQLLQPVLVLVLMPTNIIHLATYPYVPARRYEGDGWRKKYVKNRYNTYAGVIHLRLNPEPSTLPRPDSQMTPATSVVNEPLVSAAQIQTPPQQQPPQQQPPQQAPQPNPRAAQDARELADKVVGLSALAVAAAGGSVEALTGLATAVKTLETRAQQLQYELSLQGHLMVAAGQGVALQSAEMSLFIARTKLTETRSALEAELEIAGQSWHLRNPEAAIGIAAGVGVVVGAAAGVGAAMYFGWGSAEAPIDAANVLGR